MKIIGRTSVLLGLITCVLASCAESNPSVTLPLAGKWQWSNTNPAATGTISEAKLACLGEADEIQSLISKCSTVKPKACEGVGDNVTIAMCNYSNSITKNNCSVGRMSIPKEEIMDGCIAARGWKQIWVQPEG